MGEEPPFVRLTKFMSNGWWFLLRTDGREQLCVAVQMLENIGMEASVGRARRELRAAGGTACQAAITAAVQLTARRHRSPGWPPVACPTRRSPPGCS